MFFEAQNRDFLVHTDDSIRYAHSDTIGKVLERLQETLKNLIAEIVL